MAEKKRNDATSILAKIRQKMNKIEQSDDEINLDEGMQDLSPSLDEENDQPVSQNKYSAKNEAISKKSNLEFKDDDIFSDIVSETSEENKSSNDSKITSDTDSDFDLDELLNSEPSSANTESQMEKTSIEKNKKDIIDDEDLKLDDDLDLEIEDEPKSKQEQNEENDDDLEDVNLDELEESNNQSKESESNTQEQDNQLDDLDDLLLDSDDQPSLNKNNTTGESSEKESEDDDLNFDFLEEKIEVEKPIISSENKTESSFNKDDLHELDDLDLEETENDPEPLKQQDSSNLNQEKEEELFEEDDMFEEEVDNKTNFKEEKIDQNQQFYQQQSKPDMISKKVMDEAQQSIKKLVQAVPKKQEMLFERSPAFKSGETVEDMVMSILRPKLEQWFNENLPVMVEKIVREEIKKIIPKDED